MRFHPWKPTDYHIVFLSLVVGLGFGLSFGDGGSNHPTYIPPGLRLLDPTLLAHDWWATTVTHYHWAFTALVAGLAALGILPWGMAIGNVLLIAAFLWVLWRLIDRLTNADLAMSLAVWAIAAYFVAATDGLSSVGESFLFSASLQPSTIAAVATLIALLCFMERRFLAAGCALAVGGLFHVNFLILNILFFGLAQLIWAIFDRPVRIVSLIVDGMKLHGLSLVLVAIFLPLIIGVAVGSVTKEDADFARFVVHEFALPFHYDAKSYLPTFWSLVGWQLIGLAWTRIAIPDATARRFWWAVQLSLMAIIWTAAFFATVLNVKQIVQLFVWRLAPFSELVAVLLSALGVFRAVQSTEPRLSWTIQIATLLGALAIARTVQYKFGVLSLKGVGLLLLPVGLLVTVAIKALAERLRSIAMPGLRAHAPALVLAYVLCALGIAMISDPSRFNLVAPTALQSDENELYQWVRRTTPNDAQFVIPPDLQGFRLFAHRAIIVDLKAVPYETTSVLEWYRRLEAISGTSKPQGMEDVLAGYPHLDAQRLSVLRAKHQIGYAVVRTGADGLGADWVEVFRNRSFAVFRRRASS